MKKLNKLVEFVSGTPQFRITESFNNQSPIYTFYSQTDLWEDLVGVPAEDNEKKSIQTKDKVNTLSTGDVIFSLISGSATVVREEHQGYLFTQNYVKFVPKEKIDRQFLVYLFNENRAIKKQLMIGLQGSTVLKYTLKQIKDLEVPILPSTEKQKVIGEIYFKQLRLQALKTRAARQETMIRLHQLEEVMKHD
ncbi:restriction endonuclease subunit S [Eubacteriaceae bacterium ES3]|nr:restriction endonuclease subunit S [Eubacteriaceae bacterium ES3]